MLIKEGDKGVDVANVQKLLSLLGYDLIIDGDFGQKTTRSVKAFQKKYNLTTDGVVGDKTYQLLKASQKKTLKEEHDVKEESIVSDNVLNIVYNNLDSNQYIKQKFEKKQVYLHFTAGGPDAQNVIYGWNSDEPRIATSFVIDGNTGGIVQCFDPNFWSYHLGVKGTNGKLDKSSIGIEICNWGPLDEKDGKYYAWPAKSKNKWVSSYEIPKQDVIILDKPHRGYKYFHKITDKQIESVEKLLLFLVKEFKIDINNTFGFDWFDYKEDVIKNVTPGIWTHVTVRKDKSDLCPDKRVLDMLNGLKQKM